MPHLLATLRNVPLKIIEEVLEKDKEYHISQGMYLKYIWQNANDENEVLFLFQIDDIDSTKALIHKLHSETLAQNPNANLPVMKYLQ